MGNGAFIVNSTPVTVGDAKFTLFRLKNDLDSVSDTRAITLHCHLFYEIKLVLCGSYDYAFKKDSVTVSQGEMLIVPPHEYHFSRPADGENNEYVISLTVEKTDGKENVFSEIKRVLCEKSCIAVKTSAGFEESVSEYLSFPCDRPSENFGIMCKEHLLASRVIYELSKSIGFDESADRIFKENEKTKKNSDAAILLELVNCGEAITLAEIAHQMNYSVKHTARLIKEQFGMPYGELVRTRRLESAKKLLSDTDIPINLVSSQTGYRSPSALYRDMKKYENTTPTQYREENTKRK